MLKIKRTTEDARLHRKGKRLILEIGDRCIHISRREAKSLRRDLARFNLEEK